MASGDKHDLPTLLLRASPSVMGYHTTRNYPGTLGAVSHKIDRPYHLSRCFFPTLYSPSLSQSCQLPESHPDLHPSPLLSPSILRLNSLGHSSTLPPSISQDLALSCVFSAQRPNCKSDHTSHVLETHLWLPAH